jgi:hypothetical protein
MAVTYNRYKCVTVSLPKRLRNGRFISETATWIQKRLKLETTRWILYFIQLWCYVRIILYVLYVQYTAPSTLQYNVSGLDGVCTPQLFYTYCYNHAHRLRLEKLLCLEPSRSSNEFFKPLLDPGDGFTSETTEKQFQK